MGFGLLFIGYLALNVMSYTLVPKFIGYALIMWGCIKLSDYDLKFKHCILPVIPASILSVYSYGNKLCSYLNIETSLFPTRIVNSVILVELILSSFATVLILLAVSSIAKSTSLDKLSFRACRNIFILAFGEIVYLIALALPKSIAANTFAYFGIMVRILRVVLDLMLLFSCYRMICREGEEDMPAREVKITVLRKMEEVLNKRDSNAYEAARSITEKRQEKKKKKKK